MERIALSFLIQSQKGVYYSKLIDEDFFPEAIQKVIISILQGFHFDYQVPPSESTLISYFRKEVEKRNIPEDLRNSVERQISICYHPLPEDIQYTEDQIIAYIKKKLTTQLILKYAKELNKAPGEDLYQELYKDIGKILSVESMAHSVGSGAYFFKDFRINSEIIKMGIPSPWPELNKLTSARGFNTPELVILLSGPKSYKTLTMLCWAYYVAVIGYDVYIADFENGLQQLLTRLAQHALEATEDDLAEGIYNKVFREMVKRIKKYGGGEIRVNKFQAWKDHPGIVAQDIHRLRVEENFNPKLIIWDYIDLAGCSNSYIKDPRLIIQYNYHEIINLNTELGAFSISASKVPGSAFNKDILSLEDFGEDKSKAYNCHAAFAINTTQESRESDNPILMVSPLVQRKGVSHRPDLSVFLKVHKETQQLEQVKITLDD